MRNDRELARAMNEVDAEELIQGICFKNGPPRRTGVEVEWLLHDSDDPLCPVGAERLAPAVAEVHALPLRSAVTMEPGGQLELSSPPSASPDDCVTVVDGDLALVRDALKGHGLVLSGHGHDPWRAPRRVLTEPRYAAMESYFDRFGSAGRSMMCSTASVQVCVDSGDDTDGPHGYRFRWRLAHLLGPVLVAAFANSPLAGGRPTGWKSTRQRVWTSLDPGRTLAPAPAADPRTAWAAYVLDAPVLCVRTAGADWTAPAGLTFRDWVRGRGPRPATEDDLRYHVTTLFPPVRPRGHLELRMIDAQPGEDGWIVPLAVTTALLDDPTAAGLALRALRPLAGGTDAPERAPSHPLWRAAARHGLAHPPLRAAAVACFAAAGEALARRGAPAAVRSAVTAFTDRYVAQGRCPADDLLDTLPRKDMGS